MPLVLRYPTAMAATRDAPVLDKDNSNTLSTAVASTATTMTTMASTSPIPLNRTNTSSFLHTVDLTPPGVSWFDSQASWPLDLIPLVLTMLLSICLVAASGSRRQRILGVQNPANEQVLRQM